MTVTEMHITYKLLLDKADTNNYPDIEPEEIDLFLNLSQSRFVKQRYGVTNPKRATFESTQKRTDDLREIIKNAELTVPTSQVTDNKPNGFFVSLPADYWFMINEEVSLKAPGCNPITPASGSLKDQTAYIVTSGTITFNSIDYTKGKVFVTNVGILTYTGTGVFREVELKRTGVRPLQHDDYNRVVTDPFNKPWKNQVLRLMLDDKVELLTDGSFELETYFFRYIKKPVDIKLSTSTNCELAEQTHQEIVEMAVSMTLENIESQRYQTQLNELNKQE